ncbi:hypothetical protein LMG28140_05235 [Paraburkholderia metrosideri]|jgi:hypothetical protein|uniref:Uncharacterized protein n=1 Tax=Paraburkholderia metrosideri TaxID=580937 RepID=A0ABN7I4N0_9BURK|nr:hypothetical protein LMG28140_05235 [Paraburkholderia metrosideri]
MARLNVQVAVGVKRSRVTFDDVTFSARMRERNAEAGSSDRESAGLFIH